jgi:hypothetical protein
VTSGVTGGSLTDQLAESQKKWATDAGAQWGVAQRTKTNTQQAMDITQQKLQKYLQQRNMATGTALGQQGSDYIAASNQYAQNRATVQADWKAEQQRLLDYYRTGVWNDGQTIRDKFDVQTKTSQDELYNSLYSVYADGAYNTSKDFNDLVDANKDRLSEDGYISLKYIASYLAANKGQQALDAEYAGEEGTTLTPTQKAAQDKMWEDYKSTYNKKQYSGSVPTITNGILSVNVNGKKMYAFDEGKSTVTTGGGFNRDKEYDKWHAAGLAGFLPDGAVMDTISGTRNNHVIYYKGKFYVLTDNLNKTGIIKTF